MKNLFTVVRDFPHSEPMWVGKTVDATDWLNTDLLEQQGYIARLEPATSADPAKDEQQSEKSDAAISAAPDEDIQETEIEIEFEIKPAVEAEIIAESSGAFEEAKSGPVEKASTTPAKSPTTTAAKTTQKSPAKKGGKR